MNLKEVFAAAYVINLPERTDRRRALERELAEAGLANPGWAEFFPAVRPDSPGPFPSIGARGCFLSHLEVLRAAHSRQLPNVLILEDDLTLSPDLIKDPSPILEPLSSRAWDIAYLGHMLSTDPAASEPFAEYSGPILTAHFLAVRGTCIPRIIAFLETVLSRPPGHPDGGPMHVDGAYTTFRQQNPEIVTLIATPSVGGQRPSRSDITPKWFDQWPVLRSLVAVARKTRKTIWQDRNR